MSPLQTELSQVLASHGSHCTLFLPILSLSVISSLKIESASEGVNIKGSQLLTGVHPLLLQTLTPDQPAKKEAPNPPWLQQALTKHKGMRLFHLPGALTSHLTLPFVNTPDLLDKPEASTKILAVITLIRALAQQKTQVVVFSNLLTSLRKPSHQSSIIHPPTSKLLFLIVKKGLLSSFLAPLYPSEGLSHTLLTGRGSESVAEKEKRLFLLGRFEACLVFVGGKLVSPSLSLTPCHHAIFLDPLPLEKGFLALSRIRRTSQTQPISVYHFLSALETDGAKTQEEVLSDGYLGPVSASLSRIPLAQPPNPLDALLDNPKLHNLVTLTRWTSSPLLAWSSSQSEAPPF